MANRNTTFLLKRSNVPGKIPPASGLTSGELALNTADAILYTSGSTANDILPIGWDRIHRTGDTVTGDFIFNGGITANTISATTYLNLPIDVYVTGGTYANGTATFTNNTGGTFNVVGFPSATGSTNYYGSFSDSTTQAVSGSNIPTVWKYNTTEISNGIYIQDQSKITVSHTGIYEIGYSAQIQKTQGGQADDVTIWMKINNNDLLRSSSTLTLANNGYYSLPFVSYIVELNAGDYVEFYFSSPSPNIEIVSLTGLTTPTRPNAPSVIIVAKEIGNATIGTSGDTYVTGFTLTNSTLNLEQNRVGSYSGFSVNLPFLPLTGGTLTGALTAITYYGDGSNLTGISRGGGGGAGSKLYYFNISNTQTPYYEFSTSATTAAQQLISVSVPANTTSLVAGFMTPSNDPNITNLPAGILTFYLHLYDGSTNHSFNAYVQLYKRTTGGTETLLFTTDTASVIGNVPRMVICDAYFSGATLNLSDRLVAKIYGENITNQTRSIDFVTEGTSNYSFAITTIPNFTDIYVTGFTYSNNNITINQTQSQTPLSVNISTMTGLTINGNLTVSGNTNLTTLTATTIGASGNCVSNLFVSNINSCSPLNIQPNDSGNVYFGSTSGLTIDLANNRVGIGITSPSEKLEVSGKTKTTTFQMTTSPVNGYVLTSDASGNGTWQANGNGTVTSIATSSPITGGTITSSGTIGIQDAAADGATKGAASFTASDFNSASGVISLDYLNGQSANGTTKGFLTATDWSTFNSKQNAITLTTTGTSGASTLFGATLNIPVYANTNIYNTDGTLTGTRALNLAGNNLSFVDITGLGRFDTLLDDGGGNISQLIVEYGGISFSALGNGTGKSLYISPTSINIAGYYNLPVSSPGLNEIMYASSTSQLGFTSVKTINGNSILGSGNISITGGLTFFTEAQSTAAPNATVNVDSLTAVASTTNADIAIVPKGTGAVLRQIPDGTATAGNKRGANAVDLQSLRSAATQVASGTGSVTLGYANTASSTYSVAIGSTSVASGTQGIALGFTATASGNESAAIIGGTASNQYALAVGNAAIASNSNSIALGVNTTSSGNGALAVNRFTTADGTYSTAFNNATHTFGIQSRTVFGNFNTVVGDCQKSIIALSVRTTGNTATTLTVGGTAAGTTNQVILSNQSAYRFKGSIIGKQSGSVNAAVWDIDGFIVRGANAAATTLNISNVTLVQNTPGWGTPTLAADTTNGGLRVQVIGAAATNIQWTAVIETTEVIYA